MNQGYYIAAYTSSPGIDEWDPVVEKSFFETLSHSPKIVGIEHPYLIQSNKYPLDWLRENIPDHWTIIITALPAFMTKGKTSPYVGLASKDEKGRSQAVTMMEDICEYAQTLNQLFNRSVVKKIHFHSSPRNDEYNIRGHKLAFIQSLREIKEMGWEDIELNLEHCDAYTSSHSPEKGFLSLEEEIDTLLDVGGYGMILNWARSAIEARSILGPLAHIRMATEAQLLKGFFFSGCTLQEASDYGAWKDNHMPPHHRLLRLYEESLLNDAAIAQTFSLLNEKHYLGVKVLNATEQKTLKHSIDINMNTLSILTSNHQIV